MSGPAATLPGRLADRAAQAPDRVVMRQKVLGVWRPWTWSAYLARAAGIGLGLADLGLAPGDRVVVVGDSSPDLLACHLGVMGVGAVTAVGDPAAPADQLRSLLAAVRPRAVVVGDQEQLDKLDCPAGSAAPLVVVIDPRGVEAQGVVTVAEVQAAGAARPLDQWVAAARRLPAEAPALIGGEGDGLSHGALIAEGAALVGRLGGTPRDELLSLLPLSVRAEHAATVAGPLEAGWVINFGEGAGSVAADLWELQPTVVVAVAALWEAVAAEARSRLAGARGMKGAAARRALEGGGGVLRELLVCRPLRTRIGLGRARALVAVDREPAPEAAAFYAAVGVAVRHLDASLEVAGR